MVIPLSQNKWLRMNDELEPPRKFRDWLRLRLSTVLLAVAISAVLLAWLVDHQKLKSQVERTIDINNLVGMSFSTLDNKMQLQDALIWDSPNLPFDSFGERTYFLDGGDLIVKFDETSAVSSANFVTRVDSPKERLDAVSKGWSDYVRDRSQSNKTNN